MGMKLKCLITLTCFQQLFRSTKIDTFVFPFQARQKKVSTSLIMHTEQTLEGVYLLQIHCSCIEEYCCQKYPQSTNFFNA